jgi:hypothetical protein
MLCDREISVFRKFGDGKFCSKEHQDKFREQQNNLAVEVLHRTHDALKAYRPTGLSLDEILGPSAVAKAPLPEVLAPAAPLALAIEESVVEAYSAGHLKQPAAVWPSPAPVPGSSREFDTRSAELLSRLAGPSAGGLGPDHWSNQRFDEALEEFAETHAEAPGEPVVEEAVYEEAAVYQAEPAVYQPEAAVYQQEPAVYQEETVVYQEQAVVYREAPPYESRRQTEQTVCHFGESHKKMGGAASVSFSTMLAGWITSLFGGSASKGKRK